MPLRARRYRLLAELGRGGMGVVWRAHDERLGRQVAVKVVHDWVAADRDLKRRFELEWAALARLQHPHIVRLYDVAEEHGRTLLVMELVEGRTLAQLLAGRTLGWEDTRRVAAPIAAALAYAHGRGVVHRDLTPANILVEQESGRVVVSDFGLARLAQTGSAPVSGVLAGTPEYWSPEQAAGHETGPPSDLYSLGCLVHRLLTGTPPFAGGDRLAAGLRRVHEDPATLGSIAPDAPADACRLVDSLLVRDPAHRPTAAEIAPWLAGTRPAAAAARPAVSERREPLTLPAATLGALRVHRAGRRRRARALGLTAACLAALAGGAVYAVASMEPPGIAAPAVVGDGLAEARHEVAAAATQADVERPRVQVAGRAYSEDVPRGAVLTQDPGPGEHVASTSALLVRISLGSAWATVPDASGRKTRDALRLLGDAGFAPRRRYGPSLTVPAWHVAQTRPAAGSRLRRPAAVEVLVSTGPPRAHVPDARGDAVDDAVSALERAGFATSVQERPSTSEAPGTVLELRPAPGTKIPVGSTITVVVAREPQWVTARSFDGRDDATTDAISVPAGARVVLLAHDDSWFGFGRGWVGAAWNGDDRGSTAIDAGGETVLVEPGNTDREIAFRLEPHGSTRWELRVETVG
jgi:eukaryotic-like serine/threonine-protein kinase